MLKIDWKPDKNSVIPLYKQIINYIKGKISIGEWTVGSRLPGQRQMAALFDVNRSTIIQAFEELKADGLIGGKRKEGTVIINNTWSLLASVPPPNWEQYIHKGIHEPNLSTIQIINRQEFKEGIIRLGTGELSPELYPKASMKKILDSVSGKIHSLGYERPEGAKGLRKAVSEYVKKFGINASPEAVLIVSGSLQALQLISMSILYPGSTILAEKPSYIKSLHVFESAGMKLKGIPVDKEGININEIAKNINRATTLLYTIPTFQNPTGIVMSEKRRGELIELCTKERLPIIEDDAYRELWLDECPPVTLKAKDKSGLVLYMGTVSKCLAAGIRIGWIIGPEPVIERLGDVKMQTDYGASSLSQYVVEEWLESGLYEHNLEKLREELKIRRQFTLNLLDKYFADIAQWNIPKGGFYIWMTLKTKIDMTQLFHEAIKNNVLINIGNMYDFSNNYSIRISYSYASLSELECGLKVLAEIIFELI